jgi:Cu/Ag efflux protein CusF
MKTKRLNLTMRALLPAALMILSSCSSTPPPPPAEGTARISYTKGVPGGEIVQTVKMSATVTAIDQAERKATLLGPDGRKFDVKVGPEAVNFDQVRVGDQVNATVEERLVAHLEKQGKATSSGTVAVAALAPKGAQPSGAAGELMQETAEITAIDSKKRTVTLRFDDGTLNTFPVRDDVELSRGKVGDQVVFRFTQMVAIWVQKP